MKGRLNLWLPIFMMVVFAITCWPPLMPESLKNFSAAYAIAFCAGVYFSGRSRWVLPLATLLIVDLALNAHYSARSSSGFPIFSFYTLVKVATFACLIWLGSRFRPGNSWLKLLSGGLLGALIFYLLTNTASWVFDPSYSKTFGGWIQALTTGLPGYPPTWMFLKNTLLSGGLFTGLFAGVMKLSEAAEESEETSEESSDEPLPEEA